MPKAGGKKVKIEVVIVQENENKKICVAPFLTQEIIYEILSWLPADSLVRCKFVCKLWCTIIQEHEFIRKHLTRARFVEFYGENDDVSGDEETFEWISCADGLILERSRLTNRYRIKNPAIRQVLSLPDPNERLLSMCMFYVPTIKDYKLVYFHSIKGSRHVGCQLLTVANDLTWRSLNIPSLQNVIRNNAQVFPTCNHEAFYIVLIIEAEFGGSEIIWLDVGTECFSSVKIPRSFFSNWKNVRPMKWNQKLSLATIVEEKLHIWVLEDYKKQKWAERKIVLPLTFMKDFPSMEKLRAITIVGSRLLIDVNSEHLVYDTESKKVLHTSSTPPGKKILGYFCSSVVYLKGMQPQQRKERNE